MEKRLIWIGKAKDIKAHVSKAKEYKMEDIAVKTILEMIEVDVLVIKHENGIPTTLISI